MPSYEIRLARTLRFRELSRSRKPRVVRSSLVLRFYGIEDPGSWSQKLVRMSQEFDLGRSWKFVSSRRIEQSQEPS
jgi:hypothetical protein